MSGQTQQNKKMCRICQQTQQQFDNPLINPQCSCRGSIAWIHEDCLINQIVYKYGIIYHYKCSCCKSLIKLYKIWERKPWYIIIRDLFILLLILGVLLYTLSWLNQNGRKMAKHLWGYPQIKIIPLLGIGVALAAFIDFLYIIHWGFYGIYTGRRRYKFYEKLQN